MNGRINDFVPFLVNNTEGYSFRDLMHVIDAINRYDIKFGLNSDSSKVPSLILNRYTPENRLCKTNWGEIKEYIGDSIEIERLVYNLHKEVSEK